MSKKPRSLESLIKNRQHNALKGSAYQDSQLDVILKDGETPLTCAVYYEWREGIELLLARGANPDFPNKNGETPLMNALIHSSLHSLIVLGNCQASWVKQLANHRETPLHILYNHLLKDPDYYLAPICTTKFFSSPFSLEDFSIQNQQGISLQEIFLSPLFASHVSENHQGKYKKILAMLDHQELQSDTPSVSSQRSRHRL